MSTGMSRVCCGSSGGASLIHQASRMLDNDQFKALPSLRQTIAGAPGANVLLIPTQFLLIASFVSAYAAAADFAHLALTPDDAAGLNMWTTIFRADPGLAPLNDVLTATGTRFTLFDIPQTSQSIDWGSSFPVLRSADLSNFVNKALTIGIYGNDGDLTLGDPGNSVIVSSAFVAVDVTTGLRLSTAESGWNETTRTFI